MAIKKYDTVGCYYGEGKKDWGCNMEGEWEYFESIEFNQPKIVELSAIGGVFATDTFCSILKFKNKNQLVCSKDKEWLERQEKSLVDWGYKEADE